MEKVMFIIKLCQIIWDVGIVSSFYFKNFIGQKYLIDIISNLLVKIILLVLSQEFCEGIQRCIYEEQYLKFINKDMEWFS